MKISKEKAFSIMESLFFMSAEPRGLSELASVFQNQISSEELGRLVQEFQDSYNRPDRGIRLEKVKKGWQFRTKAENKTWLLKLKPQNIFRLSKPALEALSIIAFEQPCPKASVDETRGVDSSHLLRTLMEREMICPAGKSDLPGRPLLYKTTGKFLETFGFDSLKDLPSEKEIEELVSPGDKPVETGLPAVSSSFSSSSDLNIPYKQDEEESRKIKDQLRNLPSSVDFLTKKEALSEESEQGQEAKEDEEAEEFEEAEQGQEAEKAEEK